MVSPPGLGYDRRARSATIDDLHPEDQDRDHGDDATRLAGGLGGGGRRGPDGGAVGAGAGSAAAEPFGFALNTSTISGQKLTLEKEIELVARAGYSGIEPWTREMEQHVKDGGSIVDLGKKARDLGLAIVDVIGFFEWAVDDDARRAKGLEQARHDMEMVRQLGGTRIAAPPFGATDQANLDLRKVAERLPGPARAGRGVRGDAPGRDLGLLQADQPAGRGRDGGDRVGPPEGRDPGRRLPPPQGRVRLRRPPPARAGRDPGHPHERLPGSAARQAQRRRPGLSRGRGGALPALFRALRAIGFHGQLSLELFNRDYWKQDALTVAKTGLEKMKAAVRAGLA